MGDRIDASPSSESASAAKSTNQRSVSWGEYARSYDVMCESNDAYQQNLALFRDWLMRSDLPRDAVVCDVGAGSGNYLLEAARLLPSARLLHLDSDPYMRAQASRKYRLAGLTNIAFIDRRIENADVKPSSLDVVICINALYSFNDPTRALVKFSEWLKPDGFMFVIDLGRKMDVTSWSRFIVASSLQNGGLLRTLYRLWKGRFAVTQNSVIRANQESGRFWLHTTETFAKTLESSGLLILETGSCYREFCDYAICKRAGFASLPTSTTA
jgi:ubiquinone/menaquinone biosynthesis C-methylase UbiE